MRLIRAVQIIVVGLLFTAVVASVPVGFYVAYSTSVGDIPQQFSTHMSSLVAAGNAPVNQSDYRTDYATMVADVAWFHSITNKWIAVDSSLSSINTTLATYTPSVMYNHTLFGTNVASNLHTTLISEIHTFNHNSGAALNIMAVVIFGTLLSVIIAVVVLTIMDDGIDTLFIKMDIRMRCGKKRKESLEVKPR